MGAGTTRGAWHLGREQATLSTSQSSPPSVPMVLDEGPSGGARAKGRDCPRILAWLGRTGSGRPGTHQDGGQLLPAAHVQVEGQRVGQGTAQQQHQGEEDAEVGPREICR